MIQLGLDEEIFSPRLDLVFKAMFTQDTPASKGALMDFLSSILDKPVEDVMILENELAVDSPEEKQSVMDIHCVFNDGEHANVEIQVRNMGHMCKRAEYSVGKLHSRQTLKGLDYGELKHTYQITIVDYTLFPKSSFFFEKFEYRTLDGLELEEPCTHIYFIELTKLAELLQKPLEELTRPEMWALFIKYVDNIKQRNRINDLIQKEEGLAMASSILQQIAKDDEMRVQIFSRERAEMDRVSEANYIAKKNREEGREEGREEKCLDMAKAMVGKGISIEIVSEIAHMSIEDVKKLVQG